MKMLRVCIDPGHGGSDPGAVNGALYEKDVVLDIGKKLKELLKNAGYEVIMTRENDTYLTPRQKANIGNEKRADIFVSIHCNSASSEEANGTETLTFDEDGMSYLLGRCIQKNLISALGLKDRGIKIRKELTVLNSTSMPAVLAEIAFISNVSEKLMLVRPDFKAKTAKAIFNGIEEYFEKGGDEVTLEEAKKIVREGCGFDDNTMKYLEFYRYGDKLITRIAEKIK